MVKASFQLTGASLVTGVADARQGGIKLTAAVESLVVAVAEVREGDTKIPAAVAS
jgi:hypothetical protein